MQQRVLVTERGEMQTKGRNGWFWPHTVVVTSLEKTTGEILIDVEGSKSVTGKGEAPVSIRLTPNVAASVARAILEVAERGNACMCGSPIPLDRKSCDQCVASSPLLVWVGVIEHRHGFNHYAGMSESGLYAKMANYCRDCWEDKGPEAPDEAPEDNEACVIAYFDQHVEEFYTIEQTECGDA